MWFWENIKPIHNYFPIYSGDLTNNQKYTKMVFKVKGGNINVNECISELVDQIKAVEFNALWNVRVTSADINTIFCNAVLF